VRETLRSRQYIEERSHIGVASCPQKNKSAKWSPGKIPTGRNRLFRRRCDRHLELLTQAAGDPDRTIRIYASEFLYTLGDRRALPAVQRVFPQTTEDGKYNLVVVLKGVSPVLSTTERSSMNESLRSWRPTVGQTTRTQIDGLLAMQTVTR